MQELEESLYWMDLLVDSGEIKPSRLVELHAETAELMAIFSALTKKSRKPAA